MKTRSACSARALRSKEYKVVEARNVEAALQILGNARFDLLITDMVMPKAGGTEVMRAVRAEDPNIPVVCISGFTLNGGPRGRVDRESHLLGDAVQFEAISRYREKRD